MRIDVIRCVCCFSVLRTLGSQQAAGAAGSPRCTHGGMDEARDDKWRCRQRCKQPVNSPALPPTVLAPAALEGVGVSGAAMQMFKCARTINNVGVHVQYCDH